MNYDNGNYNNGFNTNMNPNPGPNPGAPNGYNNPGQVPTPQMQEQMNNQNNLAGGNLYDFSGDLKNINNTSNGYSNENAVYKSSKKGGGGFFAFLEFLVIIFLCLYIANDKGYIHIEFLDNLIPAKEQKKEEPKKEEPKEEEKVEVNITDDKLKTEFIQKAYYVSNVGVSSSNLISNLFIKDTKASDLTEKDKLQAITLGFQTVDKAYTIVTDVGEFKAVFPAEAQENISKTRYIDAKLVADRYKAIFGEEIKNTNIEDVCPKILYNEAYNRYYLSEICESTPVTSLLDYFVYKVTNLEDNYYVYMAVQTSQKNVDGTVTIYKDVEAKNTYRTLSSDEFNKFELNESNYKDFDCYKYTFTKKGEEIIFDNIAKITDTTNEG